jgi:hypothetical protein
VSYIFLLNPQDASSDALIPDSHYATSQLLWSPTGTELLIERSRVMDESGQALFPHQPEIWLYNVASQSLTQLVVNGYSPAWLP